MKRRLLASLAAAAWLLMPSFVARAEPRESQESLTRLAEDAYVYGYPLVLMDLTRERMLKATLVGANQFAHADTLASAKDRAVVRPNVDTLYSSAWLDLAHAPQVLHVPATERYYIMQMLDAFTNVFAAPGPRTTGKDEQEFVIIGPDYKGKTPANMKRIEAPTNMVWILGRVQVNGMGDVTQAAKVQQAFSLRPLSAATPPPPAKSSEPLGSVDTREPTPPNLIANMDAETFFSKLAALLKANPPPKADAAVVARLARLGLVPGRPFRLDARKQAALEQGLSAGKRRVAESENRLTTPVNGWQILRKDVGTYGTNYLRRAAVARAGLGANLPEDAIYPATSLDSRNEPLTGKKRYMLHFTKANLPPVNAFWSLSLYDAGGYFVENELDRYAIGDRDKLLYNRDGSLDILIQHESPSAERRSNWLPAPDGPFNLLLRLYAPKPAVITGKWSPPPVRPADVPAHPAASR